MLLPSILPNNFAGANFRIQSVAKWLKNVARAFWVLIFLIKIMCGLLCYSISLTTPILELAVSIPT
jgi:hypothetical protein